MCLVRQCKIGCVALEGLTGVKWCVLLDNVRLVVLL